MGDDSSDDEVPVPPIKFSAEAKALLGDEASVVYGSSPSSRPKTSTSDNAINRGEEHLQRKRSPPLLKSIVRTRETSPSRLQKPGTPRVVRLSVSPAGVSGNRRVSPTGSAAQSPVGTKVQDWVTPAPRPPSALSGPSSRSTGSGVVGLSEGSRRDRTQSDGSALSSAPRTTIRERSSDFDEAASQMGNMSTGRGRAEDPATQSSLRVKKVGKVSGRFLAGPARRGMKRRQDEEDQSPLHEQPDSPMQGSHDGRDSPGLVSAGDAESAPKKDVGDIWPASLNSNSNHVHFDKQPDIITGSPRESSRKKSPLPDERAKALSPILKPQSKEKPALQFKVPRLPMLPSKYDQENEPPPTFKRNKPNGLALLERQQPPRTLDDKPRMLIDTPATVSPVRQPLAPRSQNTPHRAPPPPPPKMTVLETATAAPASASQSRKKRNYISVNGKLFTRMDCIGRGGSSKVYRVMAENYKVFALKRVTLEGQDPLAIQGYKGEIDLLRKLSDVDRVVRLYDWELNEDKQTLSVLMEMGETDLNCILRQRLADISADEAATLDLCFTRYFWREMLECVRAVHKFDVVHSDLKPANFLLKQGTLKLIDFGIANAIQEDTVNVHREQHVGTPNYMSPEALVDSNAGLAGVSGHEAKLMKLGKPSDVWSLGCILYQMTYGKPPFAHITNQMQRIMAIPNPRHEVSFSATGIGGVHVPRSLIQTLRGCLNRDAKQRPTVNQLLSHNDPFLYPDSPSAGSGSREVDSEASQRAGVLSEEQRDDRVSVSEELIAKMQHYIVSHLREGQVSEDVMREWPKRFFESIKAQQQQEAGIARV